MNITSSSRSIPDLIAGRVGDFTPTERRIAEAVLEDTTLLAFGTVSDLAAHVGTSRPTIFRFAVKLGFDGYTELQEHVRDVMSRNLSRPYERIRQPYGTGVAATHASLETALSTVYELYESGALRSLCEPIAEAGTVWIITGETSRAGANVLANGLSIIRQNVRVVDDHTAGADLAGVDQNDVVVVFDFQRYRSRGINTSRALTDKGVQLIAVTDGPLSPLASITPLRIDLKVPAIGPFDSSVPAVATAELMVAEVASLLGKRAEQRIDDVEQMWETTGTYLKDTT